MEGEGEKGDGGGRWLRGKWRRGAGAKKKLF